MTINHILNIYAGQPLYRTGISVGDYPVDHHHDCNTEAPEISFPAVPSFNIPLGALIPETIDGLVVADKAISVSNVINGSTRLQPCVLLTGQAAGTLAALSVQDSVNPRDINIRKVQQTLLNAGAYLMPLVDVSPEDKDFQAIQRVTVSGILRVKGEPYKWANRSWFYPDTTLTVGEFSEGINAFDSRVALVNNLSPLTIKTTTDILNRYSGKDISAELKHLWETRMSRKFAPELTITKRELSVLVDELIRPFEAKSIGFDGNYQ
jgi:hypothetical protein